MHAGIGFDLDLLQDQNREALITQIADHAAFVAAAGLDADVRDAGLRQFGSKPPPTNCCVVELPVFDPSTATARSSLAFDGIHSRRYAELRHLRRPRLVERTMCSGNHPGPMKELTTITLRGSQKLLRMGSIRSPAALPRMAVRGRAFLSEHADHNRSRYNKSMISRERGSSASAGNAASCR